MRILFGKNLYALAFSPLTKANGMPGKPFEVK
jgi:hypothetical protein